MRARRKADCGLAKGRWHSDYTLQRVPPADCLPLRAVLERRSVRASTRGSSTVFSAGRSGQHRIACSLKSGCKRAAEERLLCASRAVGRAVGGTSAAT